MSIIQAVIASISSGGGSPPPPYSGTAWSWTSDVNQWSAGVGSIGSSTFSETAPANPSYTYPDASTGKTYDFTGTEWMSSTNLGGFANAWGTNAIAINFWFYPTAVEVQLMSEINSPSEEATYHYTVLEINNTGNVLARYLNGNNIISTNTVILNQWNHIYFAEDQQGGHLFELNGIPTNGNPIYTRSTPGANSQYFAIGLSDGSNMVTGNRFQGKIGNLTIADYVTGSTFSATKNKYRTTLTSGTALSFSGSEQDVQVTELRIDWDLGNTWTIEWWEKMDADAANFHGVMSQDSNDGGAEQPYTGPLGIDIYHANGAIQMFNGRWTFAEPSRGQWNHIAIQKNGAAVTPYINGTAVGLVGFTDPTRTLANNSVDLIIGLRSPNGVTPGYSQWFKGQLANIRISNVARYADISAFQAPTEILNDANTLLSLDGSSNGDGMLIDETARHSIINNNTTEVTIS